MIVRRSSTRLLRSGASVAALAAAWALPGTAQAQTCSMGATIDGVGPGTAVTCPGGTQLDFPGAVVLGQFTIPNGSTLTGLATGTNPAHQLWNYTAPNGAATAVFLQGIYNLRNGIGGTTVLDGPNILGLSGAGSCGAGAQYCPGTGPGVGTDVVNSAGFSGGGVAGGFLLPTAVTPYDSGVTSYLEVSDVVISEATCGGGPWACSGETTESLSSFFDSIDPAAIDAYDRCSEAGGSCVFVLLPEDEVGGTFHYGPVVSSLLPAQYEPLETDSTANAVTITGEHFADHFYTDPSGATVYFADDPTIEADRIVYLLQTHETNMAVLSQNNAAGAAGGGAQGTFSIPGADGSFLYTSPVGGDGGAFVVSFPLAVAGTDTYICGQGGCELAMAGGVDPYDDELTQPAVQPPKKFHVIPFEIVDAKQGEGVTLGGRVKLSPVQLTYLVDSTTAPPDYDLDDLDLEGLDFNDLNFGTTFDGVAEGYQANTDPDAYLSDP